MAVRYQFYHAFALLIAGLLLKNDPLLKLKWCGLLFTVGIIFFSGSLYLLCLTGEKILGAVTPMGGASFIAGWLVMIASFLKVDLNEHKKSRS
jgi:uncharacterized membrane protein YgdD (TMEM256/DUF423 family)